MLTFKHLIFKGPKITSWRLNQHCITFFEIFMTFWLISLILKKSEKNLNCTYQIFSFNCNIFSLNRYSILKYEPLLKFANMVKYDAMGLGNHDFDDGVDGIVPFIEGANFPVLASNIVNLTIFVDCGKQCIKQQFTQPSTSFIVGNSWNLCLTKFTLHQFVVFVSFGSEPIFVTS